MDNSPHGKSLSSAPAEGKPQQALKGLWFGRVPGAGFSSAMNVDTARAHPETNQSAEQPKPLPQPGGLHSEVWLTLQTEQARQLLQGRGGRPDQSPIIGLIGFADRLRVIWQAARQNDPYADWWLIQVHEAITAVASALEQQRAQLIEQLEAMSSLAISVAASERPCRVRLRFANPYAYRAAQLLGAFDRVVCTAMTARHVGVLEGAACKALQQTGARKLRVLFVLPRRYRCLKIDRAAVRAETGNARLARQVMGELPADILRGERLPPLLPRPVKSPLSVPEPSRADGKNPDGQ